MATRKPRERAVEAKPEMMVTTVRLRVEQWNALRDAAAARARDAEGGRASPRKADASAILRELVDRWIAKGAK